MNESVNKFSFPEMEEEILKFWQDESIFEKSLEATKDQKNYIFYDGPPFATGLPHHGHLVGSTLKDIIPRYFTMKGYYVDRRFGWDCHGLPVEHEIDKSLGMSAQEAVKKHGVKFYNDECRAIVGRYTTEWKKTIDRIGRWVSFDRQYKTMDKNFMESVWWVFKSLWDKDLVYKSTKVMPYSTALGTVLSNFEAGSNYEMVQDPAVTVLFKIQDSDEYIAAWTTTPWTLPSNLGLCVNSEIDYVLVKHPESSKKIYFAKERLEFYEKKLKLKLEIIKELKGSDLKGLNYKPLFNYFEAERVNGAFKVHCDDYVTTDSGTGIVHLAPSFGEDDERVMKEAGVTANVCPVSQNGKFTSEVSDFSGQYIKDADKEIIKTLKNNENLLEQSTINHSYPFCPRSKTPLIYRAIPSWYISVEKVKDKMIKANEEINWVPNHIKAGRFGKWIANAKDWAVSRNRVWGTPIPIWYNEEIDDYICMGSVKELYEYSGIMLEDLHREYTDEITFKVDGKAGEYKRIPEVLDCWFESGSMPYAQQHFPFENEEVFKEGFPAEFIAEGLDQTRGWFYTLTVLGAALFDKPAFKNVIVNGLVLAEDGKKMSKSLRNYTAPDILMDEYGADALRLLLINSSLVKAEDLKFSDEGVREMVRKVLLPWYNSFKFFQTYATVDDWKPSQKIEDFKPSNVLDAWIFSKLQTLISKVNENMQRYEIYNVVPALFDFIDDLTNWYIRLNRKRFWGDDGSQGSDKDQAYHTLYFTLGVLNKLMAPFTPFASEYFYKSLLSFDDTNNISSVHLCSFPEAQASKQKLELEDAVKRMQEVILLGRQKRIKEKVKVKVPLSELKIIHSDQKILNEISRLETAIKTELNVKNISYSTNELDFIKLYALPNSPVLGKKLGKDFGKVAGLIKKLTSGQISSLEDEGTISLGGFELDSNEVLVLREAKENTDALSNRFISIDLSCELTEELIAEGISREIINRIQKTRKESGFFVDDRIEINFFGDAEINKIALKFKDYIMTETLCEKFDVIEKFNLETQITEYEVENHNFKLALKK